MGIKKSGGSRYDPPVMVPFKVEVLNIKSETDKAIGCRFDRPRLDLIFLPKSQIEDGEQGIIMVPEWLVEKNGIENYAEDY